MFILVVIQLARIQNLKEHILDSAKILAEKQGISNINMRMVANESGIALGTIYNYFPTKGDIIAAVVADFWKAAFASINLTALRQVDFVTALELIYFELLNYLHTFKENWLEQLTLLKGTDKTISLAKEKEYLLKIHSIILVSLEQNQAVIASYSAEERIRLSKFIFETMITMLKKDEQDFSLFKKILNKILA